MTGGGLVNAKDEEFFRTLVENESQEHRLFAEGIFFVAANFVEEREGFVTAVYSPAPLPPNAAANTPKPPYPARSGLPVANAARWLA